MAEEMVPCGVPTEGRDEITYISKWQFDLLEEHILAVVAKGGTKGFPFAQLKAALAARLTAEDIEHLDNFPAVMNCVKLEMEVRGDIVRLSGLPHRLVLGQT